MTPGDAGEWSNGIYIDIQSWVNGARTVSRPPSHNFAAGHNDHLDGSLEPEDS
jgi:hypothetical protein